ncbi:MAG: glycosyltransferase family 2 protein [Lachnospiraceae bacterium]|nr:glycosyltransferase family 2 protein [Lachnospiraceae bacterium]
MQTDVREKGYLISIVVPVYNVKTDFLRCCIDSIISEKSELIEVVIIDDKSSNGCERICDEYVKKDGRVRVIHQAVNAGVSKSRNMGIRIARGEWIAFVDSDDWLEAGYLGTLMEQLTSDSDIIMFSAKRECVDASYPFGTSDGIVVYAGDEGEDSLYELRDKMLKQVLLSTHPRYDTAKYCWGKVFRRKYLIDNDIRFPDLNYCEDIVFMSRAFQRALKVTQMPERLYHYRVTANSAVNSYRPNALEEQKKFVDLMQESVDTDAFFYVALLSMQICIIKYLYHRDNPKRLLNRHREAKRYFSQYPYTDVFKHVKCDEMKRSERAKALLIKHKKYFLYCKGSELMKLKAAGYQ